MNLVITAIAAAVLVLYTQTLDTFAEVAGRNALNASDLALLRGPTEVVHSTGALALLAIATVTAIYKPAEMTRYEQRHLRQVRQAHLNASEPAR